MRKALAVLAIMLAQVTPASAQSTWDPTHGVIALISWFTRLSEHVDKVVVSEKRGQLVRSVDRLRKDLYALEADTRVLKDAVPDTVPTDAERAQLGELASELQATVKRLAGTAREVGADLRLNESPQVEESLTYGLRTRVTTLTYFQRALQESLTGRWNASEVRARLDTGIAAVNSAQLAVTEFRRGLAKTK